MNFKKRLPILLSLTTIMSLTVGCNKDSIQSDVLIAQELITTSYASVSKDNNTAISKISKEQSLLDKGDNTHRKNENFISSNQIDECISKLDNIKNKDLKDLTTLYLNTSKQISNLACFTNYNYVEPENYYSSLKTIVDDLKSNLNDVQLNNELNNELNKLGEKHNLQNKISELLNSEVNLKELTSTLK